MRLNSGRQGPKSKASRVRDKNAGSVFEQRSALARRRAHLKDEVRNCAGRAGRDAVFASLRSGHIARAGTMPVKLRAAKAALLCMLPLCQRMSGLMHAYFSIVNAVVTCFTPLTRLAISAAAFASSAVTRPNRNTSPFSVVTFTFEDFT